MVKITANLVQKLSGILVLAALTACGNNSSSTTPTSIPSSATIFYAHNMVFTNQSTPTLLSSGYNGFGQLGTGDLGTRNTFGPIVGNFRFNGFAIGGDHTVAFMNNSTVRSWGYNAFGQLGNGSTAYSAVPVPVFSLVSTATRDTKVNLTGITAVAAGVYHTLALKNDDTLWSWGANGAGQLGVEATVNQGLGYSPVPVRVNAGGVVLANISSIAANAYHSLARANGRVWAWGYNGTGQLGIDPKTTGALATPSPVAGLPSGGILGIAAGGSFNLALAGSGTVWAWGYNATGQLGNNSTVDSYLPVQVLKKDALGNISPLTGVRQVSAGIQHGLALLDDGSVWAWGYNAFWALGNNSNLDSPVAVQVLSDGITPFTGATEVRAFGNSSMARKVGGAWYVWGNSTSGQLGTGAYERVPFPRLIPGI